MPRGVSKDASHLREWLEKTVIIVDGEVLDNGSIDLDNDSPVAVAIIVNVTGIGRNPGAIAAGQGDHPDAALQAAHEILEDWEQEHYGDGGDVSTETFDGQAWELSVEDFMAAIEGTEAAKYLDVVGGEEEVEETGRHQVRSTMAKGIRSYGPGKFYTIVDSYAFDLGADEETSYPDGGGWYGLLSLNRDALDDIRARAADHDDQLTKEEEDLINGSAAVIFFERSDGIVEADWFDDMKEAAKEWDAIEEEVGEANEDEDEDAEEEEEVG